MDTLLKPIILAKLSTDGYFIFELQGRCMQPLLMEGDKAYVVPVDKPELGDLALISLGGNSIALHRIVFVGSKSVITKGDYSGKAEDVALSCVLGVAHKFSLKGSPWVEELRAREEIESLAELSLVLSQKRSMSETKLIRERIWDYNEQARKHMIKVAYQAKS